MPASAPAKSSAVTVSSAGGAPARQAESRSRPRQSGGDDRQRGQHEIHLHEAVLNLNDRGGGECRQLLPAAAVTAAQSIIQVPIRSRRDDRGGRRMLGHRRDGDCERNDQRAVEPVPADRDEDLRCSRCRRRSAHQQRDRGKAGDHQPASSTAVFTPRRRNGDSGRCSSISARRSTDRPRQPNRRTAAGKWRRFRTPNVGVQMPMSGAHTIPQPTPAPARFGVVSNGADKGETDERPDACEHRPNERAAISSRHSLRNNQTRGLPAEAASETSDSRGRVR